MLGLGSYESSGDDEDREAPSSANLKVHTPQTGQLLTISVPLV